MGAVPDSMRAATPVSAGRTVADVMLRGPRVLAVDATVGQVRDALEDDHLHMVLLTLGPLLRGTIVRGDIPGTVPETQRALAFARLSGRTVPPTAPAAAVMRRLVNHRQRRLAVVGERGELLGLVCLKARQTGFCSDRDVAARARRPEPS